MSHGLLHDSSVDLAGCENEPIHIPNAIQPHGCILVIDVVSRRILRASDNLADYPGLELKQVVGRSVDDILPVAIVRFLDAYDSVAEGEPPGRSDAVLPAGDSSSVRVSLSLFRSGSSLVMEIEACPPQSATGTYLFLALEGFLSGLRALPGRQALLQAIVDEVARRTEYAHVMAYRFDRNWNGEVIVERRDEGRESYLGHCFPASDIPAQARALYAVNPIRHTPDARYRPVPLSPAPSSGDDAVVDMTWCAVRSISPVHREYLRNMGVCSSLSVSLMIDGQLWGMILAHHPSPHYVSPMVRSYLQIAVQIASDRLRVAIQREAEMDATAIMRQVRMVLSKLDVERAGLLSALQQCDELLGAFEADALTVRLYGQQVVLGRSLPEDTMQLIEEQISDDAREGPVGCDNIGERIPAFKDPDRRQWLGGFLYARLASDRSDAVLFLRAERVRSEVWAGNPGESHFVDDKEQFPCIHPRHSFEAWQREVRGCSVPWRDGHRLAVERLMGGLARRLAGEVERLLRHRADFDALTQLPNRALLNDRLSQACRRAHRAGGYFALLFLDLNGFKPVNDRFGHEAGDQVLIAVARQFATVLREVDTVARIGGDEFVFLLEGFSDLESARLAGAQCADRVVSELEALRFEQPQIRITCSIGIAIYPLDGDEAEILLRVADQAMYGLKGQSARRHAFASDPSRPEAERTSPAPTR